MDGRRIFTWLKHIASGQEQLGFEEKWQHHLLGTAKKDDLVAWFRGSATLHFIFRIQ